MDEPLLIWARLMLRLSLVLLAIGLVPLLAVGTILQGASPMIPVLLSLTIAPLGGLCLLATIILFLAAWVRRQPRQP